MKTIIKRIVGFIEVLFGVFIISFTIARIFFNTGYPFKIGHLFAFPIGYLFIKFGWRWMFNVFDIMDENELVPKDIEYQNAVIKAQENIELFICYIRQGNFKCRVLLPHPYKHKKRVWNDAEYFDTENIRIIASPVRYLKLFSKPINRIVPATKIEDWLVQKDNLLVGLYTVRALADKAIKEGYKLNKRSQYLLNTIIN